MKGETMENVEPVEYDYGKKRNWRRWVWGRIRARIKKPNNQKVVVYLPGGNNLDALVAEEKGFDLRNLFAVEKDTEKVKALRKMGVNVINDTLSNVVIGWKGFPKIDAVIGDYCGGVCQDAMRIASMLPSVEGLSRQCLFCFNFLRGRDPLFSECRAVYQKIWDRGETHRGLLFSASVFSFTLGEVVKFLEETVKMGVVSEKESDDFYKQAQGDFTNGFDFEFNSYKNRAGNTFYDSVVFNAGFVHPYFKKEYRLLYDVKLTLRKGFLSETRRLIAAAKAHRTMRLKNKIYPGVVWNRKTSRHRRKAR
jgi:hypothetical protein